MLRVSLIHLCFCFPFLKLRLKLIASRLSLPLLDFHFPINFLSIEAPLRQLHLPLRCGLVLELSDFVPQRFHDRRRVCAGGRDRDGSGQLGHGSFPSA
jgi:hypothetical protein